MDNRDVASRWHGNADVWSRHVRAGYDTFRDHLNNPAFFALIGDIEGMVALDAGCGEGYNTRLLARRGARMTGVDIAEGMIEQARAAEVSDQQGCGGSTNGSPFLRDRRHPCPRSISVSSASGRWGSAPI